MRQLGSIWINLAFFDLFQGKLSFARLGKLFSRGGLVVPPPPKYLPGVLKRGRLRDDLFDLWCRHLLCFFFPRLSGCPARRHQTALDFVGYYFEVALLFFSIIHHHLPPPPAVPNAGPKRSPRPRALWHWSKSPRRAR